MKYDVLIDRVKDEIYRENPALLSDDGINTTDLDLVVGVTIKALGFQVTRDHDIVTVAPAPAPSFDSTQSNVNRRFRGKRR